MSNVQCPIYHYSNDILKLYKIEKNIEIIYDFTIYVIQ